MSAARVLVDRPLATKYAEQDDVLDRIATHVHSLPSISGVAIVALRERAMVCCARQGNAPELGTRITSDAKLSLESIATGKVVVCNDTELDFRIDSCLLAAGVKAITVIPLFAGGTVAGLLEVMSSQIGLFDDAFIRTLLRPAAGLIEELVFGPLHLADRQQIDDMDRAQTDVVDARIPLGHIIPEHPPQKMFASSLLLAILIVFAPVIVWQLRDFATGRDSSILYQDRTGQQHATTLSKAKRRHMPVLARNSGTVYSEPMQDERRSRPKRGSIHSPVNPHWKTASDSNKVDVPSVYPPKAELSLSSLDASELVHLGDTFRYGSGVPRDYLKAVKFYQAAADQGNVTAKDNLGDMYAQGQGVTQDYQEAVKLYRLAAEEGYAVAQNHLADMLRDGRGIVQDFAEAAKWYRMAAENGNPAARDNFAQALHTGSGVARDDFESWRWSLAAANQRYATAQIHLGDMLRDGSGVDRLMSVMSDYDQWRFGKLDPEKMKFKIDRQHFRLMVGGFDLGMENLTPEELADCFNAMCTCGKAHFPENLRKLRSRIVEAVEEIQRSEQSPSPGTS